MNNQTIELYTDGSCIANPGPGGTAYLIRYHTTKDNQPHTEVIEESTGYRSSTNNRMEVLSAIQGVEVILNGIANQTYQGNKINLMSDSGYFCDANNKGWLTKWASNNWMTSGGYTFKTKDGREQTTKSKPVSNRDLWEQWLSISNRARAMAVNIEIAHVYGHSGHEWNERCDKLAKSASSRGDGYLVDEGYEQSRMRG